jgi:hypothetical protein
MTTEHSQATMMTPWKRVAQAIDWRVRQWRWDARFFPTRLAAWLGALRRLGRHRFMSEQELRATRKSNTIFIFGSGASLNAITPDEWSRIARHDTMGFNWFVHQRFVRCDYHLVREIGGSEMDEAHWKPYLYEYFERLRGNPMFAQGVLLVQAGLRATGSNRAIWFELISREQRIFATPHIQVRRYAAASRTVEGRCVSA